jgi:hypothetical protein
MGKLYIRNDGRLVDPCKAFTSDAETSNKLFKQL